MDIDGLHRDAALAGEPHRVAGADRCRLGDIGVLVHDGDAVAAEFERDPAQPRCRLDLSAGARRTGEGDEIDPGIADQRRADDVAIEHVEHAGGRAGLDEDLRQLVDHARRLRRRLQHQRISGRDRRRDLVAGEIHRRIERRDPRHHADRKAQHEADLSGAHGAGVERDVLALDSHGLFGRQRKRVLGTDDLGPGVLDRLAGLARHDLGDPVRPFDQQCCGAPQQRGALISRRGGGFRLGLDRGIERVIEVGQGRARGMGDDLVAIGVAHLIGLGGLAPFAADQHRNFGWAGLAAGFAAETGLISRPPGLGKAGA